MTAEEAAALAGPSAAGIQGLVEEASPQIKLALNRSGNNLTITWAGCGPGVKLQQKTTLADAQWQDVPGTEGQSSATVQITGASAFYRVIKL